MQSHQLRSLLLVTSSYHYKRALKLLELESKKRNMNLAISAIAVESPNFPRSGWWATGVGWKILLSEYFKSISLRLTGGYNT